MKKTEGKRILFIYSGLFNRYSINSLEEAYISGLNPDPADLCSKSSWELLSKMLLKQILKVVYLMRNWKEATFTAEFEIWQMRSFYLLGSAIKTLNPHWRWANRQLQKELFQEGSLQMQMIKLVHIVTRKNTKQANEKEETLNRVTESLKLKWLHESVQIISQSHLSLSP